MSGHRTPHRRRRAAAVAAVAATVLLGTVAPASATEKAPGVKQSTRIADRAYPGIQLISNYYTAEVAVPEVVVDEVALQRLVSRLETQVLVGAVDSTEAAVVDALVDEIAENTTTYFKPSKTMRTTKASVGYVGTGWVVTPDGYMVTAAHVVDTPQDELVRAFAASALDTFVEQDVKELQSGGGMQFTDKQVAKLAKGIEAWDAKYLELGGVQQQLSAQIGVALPGFGKGQKGVPVEVISKGEAYPGKDVAVLKVDGQTHLPTLPVGKDADVTAGSTLYVAGYTGASTFYAGMSADSEVQPAVTEGPISAVKSNTAGVPYFQTQAPAGHGNSGGPVMDEAGDVVGILVAGSIDPGTGQTVEGQQWVLPISVVTEKLNQSNIKPTASDTTTLYNTALESYYQHYYERALPQFQQVANLYPGHPYAQEFVTKSQTAISSGQDRTPSGMGMLLVVGAVGLVVVVGVVVLLLLLRRGRTGRGGGGEIGQAPVQAAQQQLVGAGQGYAPQAQQYAQAGAQYQQPAQPYAQPQYPQQQPVQQQPAQQQPVQPQYQQPQYPAHAQPQYEQPQYQQPQYAQPQQPQQQYAPQQYPQPVGQQYAPQPPAGPQYPQQPVQQYAPQPPAQPAQPVQSVQPGFVAPQQGDAGGPAPSQRQPPA
ncbi:serine protease [Kineosporia sp. R_H_3]|uniref:S1 family peptidase n=1 Tax=Kineosporia sp. R_H_3 TaxID=1961848 RepID=UPI001179AE60|nr:serine protease [Kineosporia sp. R_H_3]